MSCGTAREDRSTGETVNTTLSTQPLGGTVGHHLDAFALAWRPTGMDGRGRIVLYNPGIAGCRWGHQARVLKSVWYCQK